MPDITMHTQRIIVLAPRDRIELLSPIGVPGPEGPPWAGGVLAAPLLLTATPNGPGATQGLGSPLVVGSSGNNTIEIGGLEVQAYGPTGVPYILYLNFEGGSVNMARGGVVVNPTNNAIELRGDSLGAATRPYMAIFDDTGTRVAYIGYPAADEVFIKAENGRQISMDSADLGTFIQTKVAAPWQIGQTGRNAIEGQLTNRVRVWIGQSLKYDMRDTAAYFVPFWDNTSSTAANLAVVGSGGQIARSTSSEKFKRNIVKIERATADLMQFESVEFESEHKADKGKKFKGFTAERMAAVNEMYATFDEDAKTKKREPVGVDDRAILATAVATIQEQQRTIEALTARVEALENA